MASEFHSIHPALALPQRSLWHHQHPTETDTEKVVRTLIHTPNTPLHTRGKLTHLISSSVKRRPVINMRRGMVRMSMKGRARDIGLDLTIHKIARHTSWMAVNKCIRPVLTCSKHVQIFIPVTEHPDLALEDLIIWKKMIIILK